MAITVLVARLVLAGVFAVAGLAKLADRPGFRRAVIDFGVPKAVAAPLGISLPLAELAVAAALIPTATAWWGAVGALGLLLLFLVGISVNLARGHKPDCHCFGQLHSAPAGWQTLARNGVLAAVAGFVVWQGWQGNPGPSAVAPFGALSAAQLLVLVGGVLVLGLLAAQWWFLLHLMRQNGRLLVRLEALESNHAIDGIVPSPNGAAHQLAAGLPVGTTAPDFALPDLDGETLTLDDLRASGKPVILLFTDPNCGPCTALLPDIGRWQREHSEKVRISPISRGTVEENRAKSEEHELAGVLMQEDREVSEAYEAYGTPSAVFVRPDGTIGSLLVGGSEAIGELVNRVVQEPARVPLLAGAPDPNAAHNGNRPCPKCGKRHPVEEAAPTMQPALEIGEPVPEIELKDLAGNDVSLKNFEGEETLVLFWNPGCGFCQQMLPDLKEWEENKPEDAPGLLVVSAGTREANEEMGLDSPVALDRELSTGRVFGAAGTPSAVLVDAEGRVASEVGVGAPAILELLSGPKRAGA